MTDGRSKDTVLATFFTHISTFSYDRARELMEKERDASRSLGSTWSHFVSVLQHLCTAEKQYTNLSFLQPKGFLRKEGSLKSIYEGVICELEKPWEVSEVSSTLDDLISLATSDLCLLVKGRLKTMEIYEKLSNIGPFPHFQPFIDVLKSVKRRDLACGYMEPWINIYFIEVDVLTDGLMMCGSLANWQFYKSLTYLQSMTEKLENWNSVVQTRETRKYSFASSLLRGVSGQVEPLLYTWFSKFRAGLLSKFSLYFYSVLNKQCSGNEMRGWMSKLPADPSNRISAFCRRSDASSVCLIFNGNGQPNFKGPGYHIKVEKESSGNVTGLDLFPCIYYNPGPPSEHWPNIVMILTDKDTELSQDSSVCFYDAGISHTYFLHLVQPRFYLVVLFEGRKPEKDSAVLQFLQETCQILRLAKIFQSLKSN